MVVLCLLCVCHGFMRVPFLNVAEIAQLGERQTEDLKVPGSIPGFGISFLLSYSLAFIFLSLCLLSKVTCQTCGTKTSRQEVFYDMSLDFPDRLVTLC